MKRRMSRRRRATAKKTTWLEMAQTACPLEVPFTVPQGQCISDINAIQNHGFTLISELELDRFEEDITLLRIVGTVHWRLEDVTQVAPDACVRLKWGLLKQLSDPNEFVLECGPYEPDSLELPWLTMREVILPCGGSIGTLEDWQFASWSYPANAKQADVDITVKRKFGTHEQLNLWAQLAVNEQPSTSPLQVTVIIIASLRALIQHD